MTDMEQKLYGALVGTVRSLEECNIGCANSKAVLAEFEAINQPQLVMHEVTGDIWRDGYAASNGWRMLSVDDLAGLRWEMYNEHGSLVDYDNYRSKLCKRHNFKLEGYCAK